MELTISITFFKAFWYDFGAKSDYLDFVFNLAYISFDAIEIFDLISSMYKRIVPWNFSF